VTHYHAIVNRPGYLPDTAEQTPAFPTAKEAWESLLESLPDELRWQPDDESDPDGPQSLTPLAIRMETMAERLIYNTGSASDGDQSYSVEWCDDDECEVSQ
jgi:hypothetical protein